MTVSLCIFVSLSLSLPLCLTPLSQVVNIAISSVFSQGN